MPLGPAPWVRLGPPDYHGFAPYWPAGVGRLLSVLSTGWTRPFWAVSNIAHCSSESIKGVEGATTGVNVSVCMRHLAIPQRNVRTSCDAYTQFTLYMCKNLFAYIWVVLNK